MRVIKAFFGIFEKIFIVLGAFAGSQIPAFMHQYMQRLSGHVAELQFLIQDIQKMASYSNQSMESYLKKFISSTDPDFSRQGQFMQDIIFRWNELSEGLNALRNSAIWERPFIFIKTFHYSIAQPTLDNFNPGIDLSMEGICYTIFGIILAILILELIKKILFKVFSSVRYLNR